MSNIITINSKALTAINKNVASKEETRYYLNGVLLQFRAGKVIAVATDGHIMAGAVIGTYGEEFTHTQDIILCRTSLERVKPARVGYEFEEIDFSNPAKPVLCGTVLDIVEGSFPDWRRIIPAETSNVWNHFNVDLLARLKKVYIGFDANKALSPEVSFNDNSVALVTLATETVPESFGILMGMRTNKDALMTQPEFTKL